MLASFLVDLRLAETSGRWRPQVGQRGTEARALFYDLTRQSNPVLRDRLHQDGGRPPFTAACLLSPAAERTLRLRFSALNRETALALNESLLDHLSSERRVPLGAEEFRIARVVFDGAEEVFAGMSDYPKVLSLPLGRRLSFRYLTPTSFRMGDANLPLPVPQSVYRGLWEKWNLFAPEGLRMDREVLTAAEHQVLPASFKLQSAVHKLKEGKVIGCKGVCRYEVLGNVNEATLRGICALTRFAFFAGVGAKTTAGMGQVVTEVSS